MRDSTERPSCSIHRCGSRSVRLSSTSGCRSRRSATPLRPHPRSPLGVARCVASRSRSTCSAAAPVARILVRGLGLGDGDAGRRPWPRSSGRQPTRARPSRGPPSHRGPTQAHWDHDAPAYFQRREDAVRTERSPSRRRGCVMGLVSVQDGAVLDATLVRMDADSLAESGA